MFIFRKQGSKKGLFPFRFCDEEHNLKFLLNIDGKKNFKLYVQGQPFETFPVRLYPIKISDSDDDSNRYFAGDIELNDVEFEDEMTWRTEDF